MSKLSECVYTWLGGCLFSCIPVFFLLVRYQGIGPDWKKPIVDLTPDFSAPLTILSGLTLLEVFKIKTKSSDVMEVIALFTFLFAFAVFFCSAIILWNSTFYTVRKNEEIPSSPRQHISEKSEKEDSAIDSDKKKINKQLSFLWIAAIFLSFAAYVILPVLYYKFNEASI